MSFAKFLLLPAYSQLLKRRHRRRLYWLGGPIFVDSWFDVGLNHGYALVFAAHWNV